MSNELTLDAKIKYYLDEDGSMWVDILIGENRSKAILAKPNEKDAEGDIYTVESIRALYEEFMQREDDITEANAVEDKETFCRGGFCCDCGGCCSC